MPTPPSRPRATAAIPYTLYYGTFVHTPTLGEVEILFNTLVGVTSDGIIDYIKANYAETASPLAYFAQHGPHDGDKPHNFEFIDYSQDPTKFIVPGFVDTHIHASQYPNIGIGLDCQLLDWLHQYTFPLENRFSSDLEMAADVYAKVIAKTLACGTTCASYFTTIDPETTKLFADLVLGLGQRGFVGKVCMDHNETYRDYEEDFDTCAASMALVIDHVHQINPANEHLVTPIVTPRFAPVCSRKMLKYLGKLSKDHGLPIQTHISESKKEIELVRELFPECRDYASVYEQHDLLTNSTILAHAVHLTADERRAIKNNNCSISHCPTSNTFISSGAAPVKQYLYEDKINVSLGTDVSGGFDLSILSIIKHSILVSHHVSMQSNTDEKISLADGLYMATQGGAAAVGLHDTIGTFAVGKKFDAQMVDLRSPGSNVDVFEWQLPNGSDRTKKMADLLGKWVFGGDDRNCVRVWCNGRLVVDKSDGWTSDERWIFIDKVQSK